MDIVWLHGFPLAPRSWDAELVRFGGLAPHLIDADAETLDAMADLALAAADDAGYESFAVVGHSMGGYVALRLADRVPHRIECLVLASSRADPDTVETKAARDRTIEEIGSNGAEVATAALRKDLADAPEVLAPAIATALDHPPAALAAALRAIRDRPDARPILPRIRLPTLVLVGERDAIIPPAAQRAMADAIPRARIVTLEGAGHFVNLESPEEFARHVGAFLEAVIPAPQGW